ncbi:hypothetical protein [Methanomethylovorans sp.]|uniref:hypothetical protein n=1 Tax=Methanomethylovorans sp. TaxID=2758717 RepID=UPI001BD4EA85|nr:hypothetical protein [Methanomethylovorans sp.]
MENIFWDKTEVMLLGVRGRMTWQMKNELPGVAKDLLLLSPKGNGYKDNTENTGMFMFLPAIKKMIDNAGIHFETRI